VPGLSSFWHYCCGYGTVRLQVASRLFLAMFLGMSLRGLFTMITGVSCMSPRGVGVVCALLMSSGVVVLGRFTVMVGSIRMVFRRFLVMFGGFLRADPRSC
jgi:hypothetical protein